MMRCKPPTSASAAMGATPSVATEPALARAPASFGIRAEVMAPWRVRPCAYVGGGPEAPAPAGGASEAPLAACAALPVPAGATSAALVGWRRLLKS